MSIASKTNKVVNWGNYPQIEAEVAAPEFEEALRAALAAEGTLLARGNGRCYGDAALHHRILSTLRWNKFLDFDEEKGILECQSGVLLSDILDFIVPRGWFLPVTPGTRFITLGGAIAADVHGKNHHRDGCFSQHLLYFDLLVGTGEIYRCSPTEHADLFWETVGNMGLTGIILRARFQLQPIETAYIRQETIQAKNLAEIMSLFEASVSWTYTVAWIDCYQSDASVGRSLLIRGEHALHSELPPQLRSAPLLLKKRRRWTIPFHFPNWALNPLSIRAFNFLFYHKERLLKNTKIVPYDTFFYPLDAILHWNRMYGKKGFTQYQFVLPQENSRKGLQEILQTIRQSGQGSFLTVLKLFGPGHPRARHAFPIAGYTLALDFKINANLPHLIQQLDTLVRNYAGRIYRAKDAFSDPKLSLYAPIKRDAKFDSVQAQRLGE